MPNATSSLIGALLDARAGLRRWRRRPFLGVSVVLILAVAVSVAAATFSIVDGMLLRPLPYADPSALVRIFGVATRADATGVPQLRDREGVSVDTWRTLDASAAFVAAGAWQSPRRMILTDTNEPVSVMRASSNLLDVLGLAPVAGGAFGRDADVGLSDAALIGHHVWRTRFSSSASIVGVPIVLDHGPFGELRRHVVGVLPPDFALGGEQVDVLLPFDGSAAFVDVVGRLRPGVPVSAAAALAQSAVADEAGPGTRSARAVPLSQDERREVRTPLLVQFGGALLVMLVAASCIGVLFHQELHRRSADASIRSALGASPLAAIRPFAVEFSALAALGIAAAVPLAWWLTTLLIVAAPPALVQGAALRAPRAAMLWAVVGGVLVAAVPVATASIAAFRHGRGAPASTLAGSGRATGRMSGQRVVVALQLAISLVLATAAGLFGETFLRLAAEPLGFEPTRLLVISTVSPASLSSVAASHANSLTGNPVLQAIASVPGVTSAAATTGAPLRGRTTSTSLLLDGRTRPIEHRVVSSGYFQTVGVTAVEGALLSAAVDPGRAAVVSRAFAREFFGGTAIGRTFVAMDETFHIIGVVPDIKVDDMRDDEAPIFYTSTGPSQGRIDFVVRTSRDTTEILPSLRAAITETDAGMTMTAAYAFDDLVRSLTAPERFRARLSTWFALAALLLASLALYAVARSLAESRSREFGVRLALGATGVDVRRLVLLDMLRLLMAGLALGLPLAYALARFTASMVFGVSPTAPHTFLVSSILLAVAVLCATLEPALRSARISPAELLRHS